MKDCPKDVVATGRSLIKARKFAKKASQKIDEAIAELESATDTMRAEHGAKAMQSGEAIALLRDAQRSYGLIMQAHNSLRGVLVECDVEQPTDDQVNSFR